MNELDLLVLGSGVAGLSAAVRAAEAGLSVGVLTKGELEQATALGSGWGGRSAVARSGGARSALGRHLGSRRGVVRPGGGAGVGR